MLALTHFRSKAAGVADLLQWAALVDSGVVITKSGALIAGYYYRGQDIASSTDDERNFIAERVNAALARLGSGWATWTETIRVEAPAYSERSASHFPDPVTELIDAERRAYFEKLGNMYQSEHALIVMYMPPLRSVSKLGEVIYDDDSVDAKADPGPRLRAQFDKALGDLEDLLSSVLTMQRMRGYTLRERLPRDGQGDPTGPEVLYDELVDFLNYTLTGDASPVRIPPVPMYMDAYMGGRELWPGDTPKYGNKFIGVVALEGFPSATYPNILDVLNHLPMAYRWSTRFIFLDQQTALKDLGRFRRKWKQKQRGFFAQLFKIESSQINQDAVDMTDQTEAAIADAQSALVTFGYYTSVVVLMHETREAIEESARQIVRDVSRLGFNARVETVNTMQAWLGSIPGHAEPNIRRPLMHTLNLADLLPLSSVWAGREENPCPFYPPKSPPLLYAATTGATPFRLNLHVGDLGHTLIFGPTGAGKSTLLCAIAAQFRRYPDANVVAFDNGRSMYALCKASGGKFFDIGSDNETIGFAPLQFIDTPSDRAWAEEWVATCFELQAGRAPTPRQKTLIHQAVDRLAASNVGRSFTEFLTELQDQEMQDALKHYTLDGPLGHLLDAQRDGLEMDKFMVFEMSELMALGEKNLIPVLLYVFRRIDRMSKDAGPPGALILDEAWVMLGHPVFRAKLREWLKKKRKENWAIIPATQSLSDAANSGILDVLIESCPTKILLPNVEADKTGTAENPGPADLYRMFGLNDQEIQILKTATPKRHYYITSPEGRRLVDLALGPIALSFVAVSDKAAVARTRDLAAEYGAEWPYHWLNEKGVSYEHLA